MRPSRLRLIASAVAALPIAAAHGAEPAADDGGATVVALELNKLEPVQGACRVYLTVRNGAQPYDDFSLDLVLFGKDGVISRRLSADVAPLRAKKRQVKLFDIPGMDCGAIGGVLVNDVLDCRPGGIAAGDAGACLDRLEVGSRVAGVDLSR